MIEKKKQRKVQQALPPNQFPAGDRVDVKRNNRNWISNWIYGKIGEHQKICSRRETE